MPKLKAIRRKKHKCNTCKGKGYQSFWEYNIDRMGHDWDRSNYSPMNPFMNCNNCGMCCEYVQESLWVQYKIGTCPGKKTR